MFCYQCIDNSSSSRTCYKLLSVVIQRPWCLSWSVRFKPISARPWQAWNLQQRLASYMNPPPKPYRWRSIPQVHNTHIGTARKKSKTLDAWSETVAWLPWAFFVYDFQRLDFPILSAWLGVFSGIVSEVLIQDGCPQCTSSGHINHYYLQMLCALSNMSLFKQHASADGQVMFCKNAALSVTLRIMALLRDSFGSIAWICCLI